MASSRRQRVTELWASGATYQEIADELHTTRTAITNLIVKMRRTGWDLPYRRDPHPQAAPVRDQIARMWADGEPVTEIARLLGKTPKEVSSIISQMRNHPQSRWDMPRRDRAARRGEVTAMRAEGATYQEIADELGYTLGSVRTILSAERHSRG